MLIEIQGPGLKQAQNSKTEQTCQEIKYLDNFNKIAIMMSFKRHVQFIVRC